MYCKLLNMYDNDDNDVCLFCLDVAEVSVNTFGCNCKLIYHQECMNSWIALSNKCPVCKHYNINVRVVENRNNMQIIKEYFITCCVSIYLICTVIVCIYVLVKRLSSY